LAPGAILGEKATGKIGERKLSGPEGNIELRQNVRGPRGGGIEGNGDRSKVYKEVSAEGSKKI